VCVILFIYINLLFAIERKREHTKNRLSLIVGNRDAFYGTYCEHIKIK
jgi:hypothetical protein